MGMNNAGFGSLPAKTIEVRQFQEECLHVIREIEQGGGDVIITRHGEPVARVTGHVGSLPVPFFGCDADTLEVFVDDLSTVSAFAEDVDARLRHEAERRGITISELTREAIQAHLGARRTLGAAAVGRSGQDDNSERVEETLASDVAP